jgi:hypothetical protein
MSFKLNKLSKSNYPPINSTVLVKTESAGYTYDVACYVGLRKDGSNTYHRWLLGNIEIEPKLITHWAFIEEKETIMQLVKRRLTQLLKHD